MNSKDHKKAAYEQMIFGEFASAANLKIDPDSILSEQRFPDVSCTIAGLRHYFELTEVVDEDLARNVSINLKTRITNGGPYSDDTPILKAFSGKASKAKSQYANLSGNLELVAYYDKQPPPVELQSVTKRQLSWIMRDMVLFGLWTRLWIFDARTRTVLWMMSESAPG